MQGTTHLVFGTASATLLVGYGGLGTGLSSNGTLGNLFIQGHSAALHGAGSWFAVAVAGAVGSLIPDIDQPGSLVTRAPRKQARSMSRFLPDGISRGVLLAAGTVASWLLGGAADRSRSLRRLTFYLVALILLAVNAAMRWLPALLPLPNTSLRQPMELVLCVGGAASLLIAVGGVAGLVHRLPGHHRGWTHAPPLAIAVVALAVFSGSALLPGLPGIGAAFGVGYISHLAADALTRRGIPLWWPGEKRASLHLLPGPLRVRTGGPGETLFNGIWPVVMLLYLWIRTVR